VAIEKGLNFSHDIFPFQILLKNKDGCLATLFLTTAGHYRQNFLPGILVVPKTLNNFRKYV
jgi:hypothetical protein